MERKICLQAWELAQLHQTVDRMSNMHETHVAREEMQ